MQSLRPLALVLLLPLVGACASDPDSGDSADSSRISSSDSGEGSATSASFVTDFADACQNSSNWDREMCECAGQKAQEELSDLGRAFILATLREDIPEIERLRPSLSIEEATQSGLFMAQAGAACAQ